MPPKKSTVSSIPAIIDDSKIDDSKIAGTYKLMNQVQHVLELPDTYAGSIQKGEY